MGTLNVSAVMELLLLSNLTLRIRPHWVPKIHKAVFVWMWPITNEGKCVPKRDDDLHQHSLTILRRSGNQ